MSLTSVLRAPYLRVEVDGRQVPYVFSYTASTGYDLNVAEATVIVPSVPSWANYWSVVGIRAGANQSTAQTRFVGFLVETDYTLYPRQVGLICRGALVRAQLVDAATAGGVDLSANGAGQTDQAIVQQLLDACGLTNPGPVALNIGGLSRVIGTVATKYCRWAENQKALDMINQLDQICLGYRTFDTPAGAISRVKVSTQPASSAALTFTEGVDIYQATPQVSVLPTKNRVQVTGFDPGSGAGAYNYTIEQSNPLMPLGWVTDQISNNLIESSTTGGTGISAQEVAEWWLGEVNRAIGKYLFVTPRDDQIAPGMTIAINSPNRLGINQNFWVQHVDTSIDDKGAWSQQIIVIGGVLGVPGTGSSATLGTPDGGVIGTGSSGGPGSGTPTTGSGGSQGSTPPTPGPTADFTIALQQETVLISGTETVLYELTAESTSTGASAAISTYAWSCSAGSPSSGSDTTFTTTLTSITGSQTITLTVTDANGNSSSLTQTIQTPTNGSQIASRPLYLAGTTCIEAFDGAIWHTQSETNATVVANAGAWGDSGLGVGGTWSSPDYLTTIYSANPFSSSPVTALWCETNINPKRILAGSATGEIAVSNDGGATWTMAAANVPGSITVLRCVISGTHPSQWFALTSAGLYRTDNAGGGWATVVAAAAGESFTDFVLSFSRNMIVMTGGRGMVDLAGNAQTFPAGMTGAIAIAANILHDRFYVYDALGNTAYHATDGATTLTAGAALPAGSTPQARGLWRDGRIVDLLYIAAGASVWKSVDGLKASGNYYALRTAGVSTAPAGAVYTQVGSDGQLVVPAMTATTVLSTVADSKVLDLCYGFSGTGNPEGAGGENNTPPTGWNLVNFDDSAWAAGQEGTSAGVGITTPGPSGGYWVAAISSYLGAQQLTRQSVTLPSGAISSATLEVTADDNLLGVWVNGTYLTPSDGTVLPHNFGTPVNTSVTFTVPGSLLVPGGSNLIAVWTQNDSCYGIQNQAGVCWSLGVN